MGYLKIKCEHCGWSWEVYHRNIFENDANVCPHCYRGIDRTVWESKVIPAYGEMEDLAHDILNEVTGYGKDLFDISYIADNIQRKKIIKK